jgi:hypothetical protein
MTPLAPKRLLSVPYFHFVKIRMRDLVYTARGCRDLHSTYGYVANVLSAVFASS